MLASLEAFREFRADCAANEFQYFLEVFNPNVPGLSAEDMPRFVNDFIIRCLAGLVEAERPRFLKIVYNGPAALDELASFDPSLVVGVLGGGAGTTRDCFELIHQAEKYGARVALFGRKINLAESPLDIVRFMRAVADGNISPSEAVKAYHDVLRKQDLDAASRSRGRQSNHRSRAATRLRGTRNGRASRRLERGNLVRRPQQDDSHLAPRRHDDLHRRTGSSERRFRQQHGDRFETPGRRSAGARRWA